MVRTLVATLAFALLALPAFAQYPTRAVTIVVPFPPGGGTDTGARLLAARLAQRWGQPVLVENKPGAAGMVGVEYVSKQKPDGYTLLMGNFGTQSVNPTLYAKKLAYNPDTSFVAVSLVADLPLVLVVNPSVPAREARELIALAKASPGKVTYSSSGAGGSMHLAGALFESASGTQMLHVPYKGGGPAIADLIGGHVNASFATILETSGHLKAGRLRALAVTGRARSPTLPDVPTLADTVLPGFNSSSWIGLLAPAGTPAALVQKIAADTSEALQDAELRQKLVEQGAVPAGSTPAEFQALIDDDRRRYARIIQDKNITVD
ncbi:MAG TPA: tripartite tricarboxylate transporter substrate binding protein [Usitatibacter sp.]|nr:tripartite tricarboxylate transporter substrate binding protein [Usitatibacter sp.]